MKPLAETILSRKLHDPKVAIYDWLKKYGIKNYTLNDKGEVDVDGDVNISYMDIEDIPSFIRFGVVKGDFYCYNNKLTSLKGAPKEVSGGFDCSYNKLTSLEESPERVGWSFNCSDNNLKDLKGSPEKVRGFFDCSFNDLTTLEGAPKKVEKDFYCMCNNTQFTEEDVDRVCKVKDKIVV